MTGNDEDKDEDEENDDEDEKQEQPKAPISSEPVRLMVQTNFGNPVMDVQVELNTVRTRTIGSLKKSVSRSLPGRPPELSFQLVSEGRVLGDDMLVNDLFDEEDEEDDDHDGEDDSKVLLLNSIPPVDPKFATELVPKLKDHMEDGKNTLTTEELLEAYFLNQVAISRNSQLLHDPDAGSSGAMLRSEMKERADELQEQLRSSVPEEVWQKSLESVQRNRQTEEF